KPFQWRNLGSTVEILIEKYLKLEYFTEQRSQKEAEDLARKRALAELDLAPEAKIIRQTEVILPGEENLVRIQITSEVVEDIGTRAEINQN
ncbi:MAG: sporulation protein YqfD, partial [Clostridia bacterium]|nr:sporulation protein YqfD [Clostridia bacterium]